MSRSRRQWYVVAAFALCSLGCREAVGPVPVVLQGQYRLTRINGVSVPASSDGCGVPVVSGELRIVNNEQVERNVTYGAGITTHIYNMNGSVNVNGSKLAFALSEQGGYVWHVNGTWTAGRIELSYPASCDGTTTEIFELQQ